MATNSNDGGVLSLSAAFYSSPSLHSSIPSQNRVIDIAVVFNDTPAKDDSILDTTVLTDSDTLSDVTILPDLILSQFQRT